MGTYFHVINASVTQLTKAQLLNNFCVNQTLPGLHFIPLINRKYANSIMFQKSYQHLTSGFMCFVLHISLNNI